jgi:hypothetical protein
MVLDFQFGSIKCTIPSAVRGFYEEDSLQATGHTEMSKGNSFILRDKDTYVK